MWGHVFIWSSLCCVAIQGPVHRRQSSSSVVQSSGESLCDMAGGAQHADLRHNQQAKLNSTQAVLVGLPQTRLPCALTARHSNYVAMTADCQVAVISTSTLWWLWCVHTNTPADPADRPPTSTTTALRLSLSTPMRPPTAAQIPHASAHGAKGDRKNHRQLETGRVQ